MTELSKSQPSIKQLFGTFLRLCFTAFGGPLIIAYIRKVSVEQKHWLDVESFNDGVALLSDDPGGNCDAGHGLCWIKKTRSCRGSGMFHRLWLAALFV